MRQRVPEDRWPHAALRTPETDNAPHVFHDRLSNGVGALAAVTKDGVDFRWIIHQAAHGVGNRTELGDGEIGQRRLEHAKTLAAKFGKDIRFGLAGENSIDANKVRGFVATLKALHFGRQRFESDVARLIFLAMSSAVSSRLMREASDGSDFDIFFAPSLSDMMRAPGP